jgi:glycerol-3-phosphate dehydrogenase (NAD(P)+)
MHLTVLGAGSWGTALAILLARNGHDVTLWGREGEEMLALASLRENLTYLPGFILPASVRVTTAPSDLQPCDAWVVAVPSGAVRMVAPLVTGTSPLVVVASKGLELGSSETLAEVVQDVLPDSRVGAISGPNLAVEIVRGVPTAAVAAFRDGADAERIRSAFMCRTFRVYVSEDIIGVELAGALKNVLAIAAGLSDGLGFGDNTKGALLARGLHEMSSLGLRMGAKLDTFLGVAGVGDLFATAASTLSRNYRVGRALGEGKTLSQAMHDVGQVAEGVATAEATMVLARRHGVSTPTFEATDNVIRARVRPLDAVAQLMERLPRAEAIL